jgi:hypothetical protein
MPVAFKAVINIEQVARTGIKALYKDYRRFLASTGVVVAGFGDKQYFPNYEEYDCRGLILGKFLSAKKGGILIDPQTRPSAIKPFAMTAMVETFLSGVSPDLFEKSRDDLEAILRDFGVQLRTDLGAPAIADMDLGGRLLARPVRASGKTLANTRSGRSGTAPPSAPPTRDPRYRAGAHARQCR